MTVDMSFAKVWAAREGKLTRMADPAQALKAVDLENGLTPEGETPRRPWRTSKQTRTDSYSVPHEALKSVGLEQ